MHRFFPAFLLVAAVLFSSSVSAQQRDAAKERAVEQQLEQIAPEAVEHFRRATIAMDNASYAEADSLYTLVHDSAPLFDVALRRLGSVKVSLGQKEAGIQLCEDAVAVRVSSENLFMLAMTLTNAAEGESETIANDYYVRAIVALDQGMPLDSAKEFEYNALMGQVSLNVGDILHFSRATEILIQRYPDQMVSHYYAAVLAAHHENWEQADKEIRIARKMGFPYSDMQTFLDSGVRDALEAEKDSEANWDMMTLFLWIVAGWAGGFVLLYLVGAFLSFSTLRSVEKQLAAGDASLQAGNGLRKFYKVLINVAGFYYYISLPVVLVLVVAGAVLLVYGSLMLGHIPIKLLIIVVIGAAITIFGMLRSLFVKRDRIDPGRELTEAEAPGLFALTRDVAATMGTRPIDTIRITPHTDLAVYETGSWREKLNDSGKRVLILGTGVLKDFRVADFRSVLAHEYGHFTNRDTAGGGVALRVQGDMYNYYVALYTNGQAAWWNIAFLFLRFYSFLFRRISAGATRLQEVLADRVAAQTYGNTAFRDGLTFVIRRSIEFDQVAHAEITEAEHSKRPYNNLYALSATQEADVEKELQAALHRKTSEDDTHPSPVDRFRYIKDIGSDIVPEDSRTVSSLFTNWQALTDEMTDWIKRIVATNRAMVHGE